jgi:peptidoglycan L-alanyl-D-glutamate endopeptidase CwlK
MYKFGKRSKKYIKTVHPLLQELANKSIGLSRVDFGVLNTGGLRTAEMQNKIFNDGHSRCDGYKKKSYHQSGLAIDLVPYVNGKYTWSNKRAFIDIAVAVSRTWNELVQGDYYLHWGGFWNAKDLDNDGVLEITDKLGWDVAHWELRKYEQVKNVYPVE